MNIRRSRKGTYTRYLILVLLILSGTKVRAQDEIDLGKGFLPFQAYHTMDFDSVNLTNGNLVVNIPLISYPQKGSLPEISISATYQNYGWAWIYAYDDLGDDIGGYFFLGGSPWVGWFSNEIASAYCPSGVPPLVDGTGAVHDLTYLGSSSYPTSILKALDGSGYAYTPAGYVAFSTNPRGIVSKLDCDGYTMSYSDPSGNTIAVGSGGLNDSVGRTIPMYPFLGGNSLDGSIQWLTSHTCVTEDYPGPPGSSGGTVPIQYCYDPFTISSASFDGGSGRFSFSNWGMLTSITLPNGTSWTFNYDAVGDLTSVTLPTGGTVSYTWAWSGSYNYGLMSGDYSASYYPRLVTQRTRNANDGNGDKTWAYNLNCIAPL